MNLSAPPVVYPYPKKENGRYHEIIVLARHRDLYHRFHPMRVFPLVSRMANTRSADRNRTPRRRHPERSGAESRDRLHQNTRGSGKTTNPPPSPKKNRNMITRERKRGRPKIKHIPDYTGIPENIRGEVMLICENENTTPLQKIELLLGFRTCFLEKTKISELVGRSDSFISKCNVQLLRRN